MRRHAIVALTLGLVLAGCDGGEATLDGDPVSDDIVGPCLHHPGSRKECPDTTMMALGDLRVSDLSEIRLVLVTTGGDTLQASYAPGQVDAIFLTGGAVETFLIPYYLGREGPDSARAIRGRLRRD